MEFFRKTIIKAGNNDGLVIAAILKVILIVRITSENSYWHDNQ